MEVAPSVSKKNIQVKQLRNVVWRYKKSCAFQSRCGNESSGGRGCLQELVGGAEIEKYYPKSVKSVSIL